MSRARALDWDCLEHRICLSAAGRAVPLLASQLPTDTNPYDGWLAQLYATQYPVVKADVAFLGDSIAYNFGYVYGYQTWEAQIAPLNAVDYGVSGDQTSDLLYRLKFKGELDNPPKVAVVDVGLNNIVADLQSPGETFAGIKTVVQTIRAMAPQTKILLLGVFPSGTATSWARQEENIVNRMLPRLANGRNVVFLNPGQDYIAPDGSIDAATYNEIHPNAQTYPIIADAIVPTIEAMLGETTVAASAGAGSFAKPQRGRY